MSVTKRLIKKNYVHSGVTSLHLQVVDLHVRGCFLRGYVIVSGLKGVQSHFEPSLFKKVHERGPGVTY